MTDLALLKAKRARIVMRHALRVLGDKEFVRPWMRRPNVWLGGVPLDLIETAEGFEAVMTYITQVDYGVYI